MSARSDTVSTKLRCPSAHLIYLRTPSDRTTDLLCDNLHWLRAPQWIAYKLCLVTYKTLDDRRMPDYISDFCIRVVADKRLRSSSKNLLLVPRSSKKFGDCSFSVAGTIVKNASTLETFKYQLKPIFSNNRITAIKSLNSCTARFFGLGCATAL